MAQPGLWGFGPLLYRALPECQLERNMRCAGGCVRLRKRSGVEKQNRKERLLTANKASAVSKLHSCASAQSPSAPANEGVATPIASYAYRYHPPPVAGSIPAAERRPALHPVQSPASSISLRSRAVSGMRPSQSRSDRWKPPTTALILLHCDDVPHHRDDASMRAGRKDNRATPCGRETHATMG